MANSTILLAERDPSYADLVKMACEKARVRNAVEVVRTEEEQH